MREYYILRIKELLSKCDTDTLEAIYKAIYKMLS